MAKPAVTKVPVIEVRHRRISVGHHEKSKGYIVDGYDDLWVVVKDGRRVDSFMTKAAAEAKAARLREAEHAGR